MEKYKKYGHIKILSKIAILPVKEKGLYDSQYKGNECLQIYLSVDYEDGASYYRNNDGLITRDYYGAEPRNKECICYITPLKTWLIK